MGDTIEIAKQFPDAVVVGMVELIEWTQREILELIEWTQREIIELI